MAEAQRVGSLELEQDLRTQRRMWILQRVCWVLMAAVVLAALLGLSGSGLLARATAGDAGDPLRVHYGRVDRLQSPASLSVEVAGSAITGEEVEVWLDSAYLESVEIENISPEPDSVLAGPERMTYVFTVATPGQPVEITFEIRHELFGRPRSEVGLSNGPSVTFSQIVLP